MTDQTNQNPMERTPTGMRLKDGAFYGWQVVARTEYERARKHNYAGPGTPCHPDRPGYWYMALEPEGTTLYTGVSIDESA